LENLHNLLKRQLKRFSIDLSSIPKELLDFLAAVNNTYHEFDSDKQLIERSLELSSNELFKTNTEMRAIFQSIPDMFFRLDNNGTILDIKAGDYSNFVLQPRALIGKKIQEVPSEEVGKKFSAAITELKNTKVIVDFQYSMNLLDNVEFFEARLIPLPGDQMVAMIQNITKRKKAEEALKDSENLYRSIFQNTGMASVIINEDTTIELANDEWMELSGYSKEETEGKKSWTEFVVPEDLERMRQYHTDRRNLNSTAPKKYEFRFKTRTGEIHDMMNTVSVIAGTKNSIASLFDISERKKVEAELFKLSQAISQSPASIVITDTHGFIEYVNSKFTENTGYSFGEIKGKKADILRAGREHNPEYLKIWGAITSGDEWHSEIQNKRKDGSVCWEAVSISPIKNSDGKTTNFLIVREDITEKKYLEIDLKRALDRSEESDRLKSSLLSNMSHEFRTPMTGILGMASILKELIPDSDKQSKLDAIMFSGKRLMNTLDVVLELANLEADLGPKGLAPLKISEIAMKIFPDFNARAIEKGLYFSASVKEDNLFIKSSRKNIIQIFTQLLDNAIKFTKSGGVRLVIDKVEIEESTYAKITVTDTGIGIARENQMIIFQEFRQVSEGHSRSHEGSGLGLSLVQKMVGLLKGTILVESEPGKGSEFVVLLPAEIIVPEIPADVPTEPFIVKSHTENSFPHGNALLVEDNDLNSEVIAEFLSGICEVDHAKTGEDAIAMSLAKKYDLIMMDINLGIGIDGVETAQEIRKIEGYDDVPIVAVTGYSMESDRIKFLSQGFSHFLAKPFESYEIADLVSYLLSNPKKD